MKRLFWACAGLSLGLHGALAIAWQPRATPAATTLAATATGQRQPAPLHSRLIVLPASGPSTAGQAVHARAAQHQQPGLQEPPGPTAGPPLSRVGQPPTLTAPAEPAVPAESDATAIAPPASTPSETDTDPATHAAGWDHYLPRAQLTVVPSPREDILLGYPDDGPAVGRFMLTLTLYIDEAGLVRRVDLASDEALPDTLRQTARLAFAGQRFSPGELAGDAVKSRIRIEVVYESLALPSLAANAAGGATAH